MLFIFHVIYISYLDIAGETGEESWFSDEDEEISTVGPFTSFSTVKTSSARPTVQLQSGSCKIQAAGVKSGLLTVQDQTVTCKAADQRKGQALPGQSSELQKYQGKILSVPKFNAYLYCICVIINI